MRRHWSRLRDPSGLHFALNTLLALQPGSFVQVDTQAPPEHTVPDGHGFETITCWVQTPDDDATHCLRPLEQKLPPPVHSWGMLDRVVLKTKHDPDCEHVSSAVWFGEHLRTPTDDALHPVSFTQPARQLPSFFARSHVASLAQSGPCTHRLQPSLALAQSSVPELLSFEHRFTPAVHSSVQDGDSDALGSSGRSLSSLSSPPDVSPSSVFASRTGVLGLERLPSRLSSADATSGVEPTTPASAKEAITRKERNMVVSHL